MNTKTITVVFNDRIRTKYTTPTFVSLFGRIADVKNKSVVVGMEYTFKASHALASNVERMYNVFGCVSSITIK